ncbi:MAG TPA: carboxypeptidase-like regulatory domain-containing protein [Chthoniobacterales bacterium]
MRILPTIGVGFAALFLCGSARADSKSIQGTVTGIDGKPLIDTGIWAERLDAQANPAVTKTYAKGQYTFSNLPVGVYQVVVTVKGIPKSRVKIKTRTNGWVKVDFDLRASANDKSVAQKPANSSINTIQTNDLNRMQGRVGANINNMSFPGH